MCCFACWVQSPRSVAFFTSISASDELVVHVGRVIRFSLFAFFARPE
jgi:hypothetical protein